MQREDFIDHRSSADCFMAPRPSQYAQAEASKGASCFRLFLCVRALHRLRRALHSLIHMVQQR